jgi:hypothetical protein
MERANQKLKSLLKLWNERRGERAMPARQDLGDVPVDLGQSKRLFGQPGGVFARTSSKGRGTRGSAALIAIMAIRSASIVVTC